MELRFNEVPRDWGNCFRFIEGSLYRKPRYHEFAEKQRKYSLYRGIINICFFNDVKPLKIKNVIELKETGQRG